MTKQFGEFDFDAMAELARNAPDEFARRREALIGAAIALSLHPEAGWRMQAEIDARRLHMASSRSACLMLAEELRAMARHLASAVAEMGRGAEAAVAGRETQGT